MALLQSYLADLRQIEQQTLQQLYGVKSKAVSTKTLESTSADISAFLKDLKNWRKGFQDNINAVHGSALQEVEQEREVNKILLHQHFILTCLNLLNTGKYLSIHS